MYELSAAELNAWFGQIWWPFVRLGSALM
ncbi:flagellar biosynthetic protein FliR, partial [Photobacterium aphoticum]